MIILQCKRKFHIFIHVDPLWTAKPSLQVIIYGPPQLQRKPKHFLMSPDNINRTNNHFGIKYQQI